MGSTLLFVHGGVSGTPQTVPDHLHEAVAAGANVAAAVDAVEAATRVLEDDPGLNSGTGAVLNRAGRVELDAAICDGATGGYGGVAGVAVKNPVSLARRVMDSTPHVLMVGQGAIDLGADMEPVTITQEQQHRWERAGSAGKLTDDSFGAPEFVDTVGAVALDESGNLAAASSTGGVFGKLPGRMGDAAVLGAGLFASHSAAVVGTGVGELFIQWLACFRVARMIEQGSDPQAACRAIIELIAARDPRPIGLVALDASGHIGVAYSGAALQVEGPEGTVTGKQI